MVESGAIGIESSLRGGGKLWEHPLLRDKYCAYYGEVLL